MRGVERVEELSRWREEGRRRDGLGEGHGGGEEGLLGGAR